MPEMQPKAPKARVRHKITKNTADQSTYDKSASGRGTAHNTQRERGGGETLVAVCVCVWLLVQAA